MLWIFDDYKHEPISDPLVYMVKNVLKLSQQDVLSAQLILEPCTNVCSSYLFVIQKPLSTSAVFCGQLLLRT